jgi:uncharacterized membrane protein YkgB
MSLLTPLVTLSFLITKPEGSVANLGDANFGFPLLSGAGRLVIKDLLLFAGFVVGRNRLLAGFAAQPKGSIRRSYRQLLLTGCSRTQ